MSYFTGDYLRVLTPKTINGVVPMTGPDGRVVYKESHLPVTAKRHLEASNRKRSAHLKHKIELVSAFSPRNEKSRAEVENEALKQKLAELEAALAKSKEPQVDDPAPDPSVRMASSLDDLDDDPVFEPKRGRKPKGNG